jgi:hypothetical protein
VVDSFASKEAMMHHAQAQHEYKESEDRYQHDPHGLQEGSFPVWMGRRIGVDCHLSCLYISSDASCDAGERPGQAETPRRSDCHRRNVGPAWLMV